MALPGVALPCWVCVAKAFGSHWVSGRLKGAMRAPLHMKVVLLCLAYRAFSCSLLFQSSPPLCPLLFFLSFNSLIGWELGLGGACGWVASKAGS